MKSCDWKADLALSILATTFFVGLCLLEQHLTVHLDSSSGQLLRAIVDSSIHFGVGCWCWVLARGTNSEHIGLEIFLAGVFSSAIDIDHFVEARSYHLDDLLTIGHRSFLHTILSVPVAFGVLWLSGRVLWKSVLKHESCSFLKPYKEVLFVSPYIAAVAWTSHQLRDSLRRGLSFGPFGETAPLPLHLYILLLAVTPNCIRICTSLLTRSLPTNYRTLHYESKA